jgi:hypothetical protein
VFVALKMYNKLYKPTEHRCVRIATVSADYPQSRLLKNRTLLKRYFTPAQRLWLEQRPQAWDYMVDWVGKTLSVYINVDSVSDRDWTAIGLLFDAPSPGELVRVEVFENLTGKDLYRALTGLILPDYKLFVRSIEIDHKTSDQLAVRMEIGYGNSFKHSDLYSDFLKLYTCSLSNNFYCYS